MEERGAEGNKLVVGCEIERWSEEVGGGNLRFLDTRQCHGCRNGSAVLLKLLPQLRHRLPAKTVRVASEDL